MRRTLLVLFAWLAACLPFIAQAGSKSGKTRPASASFKVLFIGNSYTYYNDMPAMFATLANAKQNARKVHTKMVAVQDSTLQMHWESGVALRTIQERKWDFVVLQEQSLLPVEDVERMFTYASRFDAEIRKSGAKTIFFLTWARRGKPEMQLALNRAYFTLANEIDALVAPVGPAWQVALRAAPSILLHMDDGSHPTPSGSYLAACVFYHMMLGNQQPCPALDHPGISHEEAAIVRGAARTATAAY